MFRLESQNVLDPVGIDVIRTIVLGIFQMNRNHRAVHLSDRLGNQLGNLYDPHVRCSDIEDQTVCFLCRSLDEKLVDIAHILDVKVGAFLLSSENSNLSSLRGMVGHDVDRQIESHPRSPAADRSRSNNDALKLVIDVPEKDWLAESLVLVVESQRNKGMILIDLGRLRDSVDRTRRTIDEASDSSFFSGQDQRLKGIVVDAGRKLFIELATGIVRDTSKMNDGFYALVPQNPVKSFGVPDVVLGKKKIGMRRGCVEPPGVIDHDFMAFIQQLRDKL